MFRLLCFTLLTSCLLCTTAYADEPIKGRAETNIRMGHQRSIVMTEFWVPFIQGSNSDRVLYGSVRMMGDNHENREGNLGLGYRQLMHRKGISGVAGIHGWLDRRITARGSTFHQITTGVEWLGERVDFRLNGYIPLSDKREISVPNADPQGPELVGTGIVVDTGGRIVEEPLGGLDLELGLELGSHSDFIQNHTDRFSVYAGGYYFDGSNTESVAGWRTRISADLSENIQIGARFQRDDVRGSQGFLEATFRFPVGHKKSFRKAGLRARLDESPERDIDIVTNEAVTDAGDRVQVLNVQTGAAQEVLHVDNTAAVGGNGSAETPFTELADAQAVASAHSIIYVHRGDGTDNNQDQGITLNQTGQRLIGSGVDFYYDGANFRTANGASPLSTLIAAATSAPVISNTTLNGDGITISADDISVSGITIDGSSRDGIVIKADGGAASAQNINIQNVTTRNNRHGIFIHGTNGGSVSAKVENSVATTNSQHGIVVYDDTSGTFNADLGGGSLGSVGQNILAANTLEDLAVDYDGQTLFAENNWWGQASGPDTDAPNIGIAPQIYYGAPASDNLIGHWTFDNEWTDATTIYDRSGRNNNGTFQGGLSLADQGSGQNGEAFDFNGTSDYISLPFFGTGVNFTEISGATWINPDIVSGVRGVFLGRGNTMHWEISGSDLRVRLEGGIFLTAQLPTVNTWTHMAFTYNRTTQNFNLYYNGTNVGTLSGNSNTATFYASGSNPQIGASAEGSRYWNGEIDDISIYNRELTAADISELYRMNTSSSVSTSGYLSSAP